MRVLRFNDSQPFRLPSLVLRFLALFASGSVALHAEPALAPVVVQRWLDQKYSLFIHFGLYSELGGVWKNQQIAQGYSEQIQANAGIPSDIYEQVAERFNPSKWDPDAIVALARKAGMRSVVITAKHHDGFCLFKTETTRFNSVDATPYGRDLLRGLSAACARQGLRFGLYFSLIDWRLHPWYQHNVNAITAAHHQTNLRQVRELLTGYGDISELWFDMGSLTKEQSHEMYELVRRLQPSCLVSGRLGNDAYDFCVLGDNQYPDYRIDSPWQTPASLFNETWGYRSWQNRGDPGPKTREKLHGLLKVVGRGGNYLLNIGPTGTGEVVPFEAEVLLRIGHWIERNAEAIYGTRANPFHEIFPWGEVTTRGEVLYLLLCGEKTDRIRIAGIDGTIRSSTFLRTLSDTPQPSRADDPPAVTCEAGVLQAFIPAHRFDPDNVQVLKIEFAGGFRVHPPSVVKGSPLVLHQGNAIKYFSYSCIDYYSNHRSIVRQQWHFDAGKREGTPTLVYTAEEAERRIQLRWGEHSETVTLSGGAPATIAAPPQAVRWGARLLSGPVNSSLENVSKTVLQCADPGQPLPDKGWKTLAVEASVGPLQARPLQACYLLQEIVSDRARPYLVQLTSGDGVQLWCNGENVLKHNNPEGRRTECVRLDLRPGANRLLVKYFNRRAYSLSGDLRPAAEQTLYRLALPQRFLNGLTSLECALVHPPSPHASLHLHNLSVELQ